MTEYCRLCAELKDSGEIVTSIDDVEQLMEEKLRACCCWTTENTEHRLPHSVCSDCLDKLDKCWLFSQSVQLAQLKLHEIFENETEIETKPLAAEILPTVCESSEYLINFPITSTAQSSRFNQQSIHDQRKQKPEHKCKICSHEFCTAEKLNAHRQQGCVRLIEIGSIVLDCKPTAVDFTESEFDIENDKKQALDDNVGLNLIDEKSTNSKSVANLHEENKKMVSRNKLSQSQKKNNKASIKRYPCKKCDQVYDTAAGLHHHRQVHTGEQRFECPLCDKSTARRQYLSQHLLSHALRSKGELKLEEKNNKFRIIQTNGGDPIYLNGKIKLFKCKDCNRILPNKQYYETHRTKHSNERPFECWLCHKTFKTQLRTKTHLKIHTPGAIKRNAVCELCGKAFVGDMALSSHKQMIHSNERPFKCETCGLRFKTESHLKKHRLTHTEVQFKCNRCEKTYRDNHSLKKHLETHTGSIAKPFVCDFCGIGFRRNVDLKDHRSIHTGEKPYSCEHCPSSFSARSSFYTHMRKVHGISLLAQKKEKMTE